MKNSIAANIQLAVERGQQSHFKIWKQSNGTIEYRIPDICHRKSQYKYANEGYVYTQSQNLTGTKETKLNAIRNKRFAPIKSRLNDLKTKSYFIAALLHQNEQLFPHWKIELMETINFIAVTNYSNIFVSIHASGNDNTIVEVELMKKEFQRLGIRNDIQANNDWDKVKEESPNTEKPSRIGKLARLRNIALRKLYDKREKEKFDEVLYFNDVYFCSTDVVDMLSIGRLADADMTCSMDLLYNTRSNGSFLFYDVWVARNINGFKFTNERPYATDPLSIALISKSKPFQVLSCWNGIVKIKADIFQQLGVRFREGRKPLECPASECELLCRDLLFLGRNKIIMVPTTAVGYQHQTFHKIQQQFVTEVAQSTWDNLNLKGFNYSSNNHFATSLECCPMRQHETFAIWTSCFMESSWNLSSSLFGLNNNFERIKTFQKLSNLFENRYPCIENTTGANDDNNNKNNHTHNISMNTSVVVNKIPRNILFIGDNIHDFENMPFLQTRVITSWWIDNPCYSFFHFDLFHEAYSIIENFKGLVKESKKILTKSMFNSDVEISNLARLIWIYENGGISVDSELFSLRPIDETIVNSQDNLVLTFDSFFDSYYQYTYEKTVLSSVNFLAAEPFHPIIKSIIEKIINNIKNPANVFRKVLKLQTAPALKLEVALKSGVGPIADVVREYPPFSSSMKILKSNGSRDGDSGIFFKIKKLPHNAITEYHSVQGGNTFVGDQGFKPTKHLSLLNKFTNNETSETNNVQAPFAILFNSGLTYSNCHFMQVRRYLALSGFAYMRTEQRMYTGDWIGQYTEDLSKHTPVWEYKVLPLNINEKNTLNGFLQLKMTNNGLTIIEATETISNELIFKDKAKIFSLEQKKQRSKGKDITSLSAMASNSIMYFELNKHGALIIVSHNKKSCFDGIKLNSKFLWSWKPSNYPIQRNVTACIFLVFRTDGVLATYPGSSPASINKPCSR